MNNINVKEKIGQIVARHPYTADVLNKFKIDYSFRGDSTLEEAINESRLNAEEVVGEIDLAVDEYKVINPDTIYWENEPIDKILDQIVDKHHRFMSDTMKEIALLFEGLPPDEKETLAELEQTFAVLQKDMAEHQKKEETELFPLLRRYSGKRTKELREKIVEDMTTMEDEHDEAGLLFKKINELTDDFALPLRPSSAFQEIYSKMDELEKDTFLHIHMENSILFKMI